MLLLLFSTICLILFNKFIHLVSAEDSEKNKVGIPNCLIIAIKCFFL